jgi:hypothetical protein
VLSEYTGRRILPTKVDVVPDPKVEGVYAVRVRGSRPFTCLIANWDVEQVEDCEFTTWPPVSGALKFFV